MSSVTEHLVNKGVEEARKETEGMSPEQRRTYYKNRIAEIDKELLEYGIVIKEHTFWCKTKTFFSTLVSIILDVVFLVTVVAIFVSLFAIIWEPTMVNVQVFATAMLFFAFIMTMVGIFSRD